MLISVLKTIIAGMLLGALLFILPPFILGALIILTFIRLLFGRRHWNRFHGEGGHHFWRRKVQFADKIRTMSDEEYDSFKSKANQSPFNN